MTSVDTTLTGRGKPRSAPVLPPELIPIVTPGPRLLTPDDSKEIAPRLARAAWLWSCRNVLGVKRMTEKMKRGQFVVKAADLQRAAEVWQEKGIAPAAWLAYQARQIARRHDANATPKAERALPMLGQMLAIKQLEQGMHRAFFREAVDGWLGGQRVRVEEQDALEREWLRRRWVWLRTGLWEPNDTRWHALVQAARSALQRAAEDVRSRAIAGDPMVRNGWLEDAP